MHVGWSNIIWILYKNMASIQNFEYFLVEKINFYISATKYIRLWCMKKIDSNYYTVFLLDYL